MPESTDDRAELARALERSAEQADAEFDARPAADPCLPCQRSATWVEIRLVDEAGEPVANVAYRIRLTDGTVHEGVTDGDGLAGFEGIDPGECDVSFPGSEIGDIRTG